MLDHEADPSPAARAATTQNALTSSLTTQRGGAGAVAAGRPKGPKL